MKRIAILCLGAILVFASFAATAVTANAENDFIKWVDFNPSSEIMYKVHSLTKKFKAMGKEDFSFSRALAYITTKNGNNFNMKTDEKNLDTLAHRVENGESIDDIYANNKYYNYNVRTYSAIFPQFFSSDENCSVKAFFPIAKAHWFNHYDDFGSSRSFGYKRKHLGHDIMGSVGTPIIAVEGGTVTELGWNMYGGWRIGVRSHDGLRFWYYAHLRKDKPYIEGLKKGDAITAGQHIGYLGRTGFSRVENTNLKTGPAHLHIGLQLIFDKSQESGSKEIWIDVYQLCRFLQQNKKAIS